MECNPVIKVKWFHVSFWYFYLILLDINSYEWYFDADERFNDDRNLAYISRWIRKSIKRYDTFDSSLKDLKAFFSGKVEEECKNSMQTVLQKCNKDQIDWKAMDLCKKNIYDNQKNELSSKVLARDNVFLPSSISQYTSDSKLSTRRQR